PPSRCVRSAQTAVPPAARSASASNASTMPIASEAMRPAPQRGRTGLAGCRTSAAWLRESVESLCVIAVSSFGVGGRLDVHLEPLKQLQAPERDDALQLLHQLLERRRRLAVDRHLVVVGEVTEERVPRLENVAGVLEQRVGVDIALADLALASVCAHE